jgi:hypothetical protein
LVIYLIVGFHDGLVIISIMCIDSHTVIHVKSLVKSHCCINVHWFMWKVLTSTTRTCALNFLTKFAMLFLRSLCMLINVFMHGCNYPIDVVDSSCFLSIIVLQVMRPSILLASACINPLLPSCTTWTTLSQLLMSEYNIGS